MRTRVAVSIALALLLSGCAGMRFTERSGYCVRGPALVVGLMAPVAETLHDAVPSAYPLMGSVEGARTAEHEAESDLKIKGGVDRYGVPYESASLCREDTTTYKW